MIHKVDRYAEKLFLIDHQSGQHKKKISIEDPGSISERGSAHQKQLNIFERL